MWQTAFWALCKSLYNTVAPVTESPIVVFFIITLLVFAFLYRTSRGDLQAAYRRIETMEAQQYVEILEAIKAARDNDVRRTCEGT
jgi:hypothetical protein